MKIYGVPVVCTKDGLEKFSDLADAVAKAVHEKSAEEVEVSYELYWDLKAIHCDYMNGSGELMLTQRAERAIWNRVCLLEKGDM